MAIIRITTGADGQSHFEDLEPRLEPLGDMSEQGTLFEGSGIVILISDS